ncbi:MAG: hypothetical protein CMO55_05340 [Verrucomicrobiales bacterium]|nr:hypothetical protein [Verrucomicrobiales bacterium]
MRAPQIDADTPKHYDAPLARETIDLLKLIHRRNDAYVGFYELGEQRSGGFKMMGAIKADCIESHFSQVAERVLGKKDVYSTVNGYWPGAKGNGLPFLKWMGKNCGFLRALNACYVDLDVGRTMEDKPDFPDSWKTWREAMAEVGQLADEGEIPQPSIFARSGRGVYVFWLLENEKGTGDPPPAFSRDQRRYKQINKAFQKALLSLAPDPAAKDAARILRVPNSEHRNGQPVRFVVQYLGDGKPPTYTMTELEEHFGMQRKQGKARRNQPDNGGRGKAGHIGLNRKRATDLEIIAKHGLIKKGFRHLMLRNYATCLFVANEAPKEVTNSLKRMARKCIPPYPSEPNDTPLSEIVNAVLNQNGEERYEAGKWKHGTVCLQLAISHTKARDMGLQTIIPESLRKERENAPTEAQERRECRRKWLAETISSLSPKPPLRVLAEMANQAGLTCTYQTIRRDLKLLSADSVQS